MYSYHVNSHTAYIQSHYLQYIGYNKYKADGCSALMALIQHTAININLGANIFTNH